MEVVCSNVNNGVHFEDRTVWKDLDRSILRQGEFTIGIFTNVGVNDKVEWIPTFFGIEITEWATWTASLEVNLTSFWNFDQGEGSALPDVTGNLSNGTLFNMEDSDWIAGVIVNGLLTDGVNEYIDTTFAPNYTITDDYSLSLWMNTTNVAGTGFGFGSGDSCPTGDEFRLQNNGVGGASWRLRVVDGTTTNNYDVTANLSTGVYTHIVFVSNKGANELRVYVNGVSTNNHTDGQSAPVDLLNCPWFIGVKSRR